MQTTGSINSNSTGVYCFHKSQKDALSLIENIELGNSLFFFDPLLFTPWEDLERVAFQRIKSYYAIRTEFVVFTFTTDWFTGRKQLELDPLPTILEETTWSDKESKTVAKMDEMFGNKLWRSEILTKDTIDLRLKKLVDSYRRRLHKWFRYVLPFPFNPKGDQIYHLFMCSNYEKGMTLTRGFYQRFSNNPPYSPDSKMMYKLFSRVHSSLAKQDTFGQKPLIWRLLQAIIREHEEGLCDRYCEDFSYIARHQWSEIQPCLQALEIFDYLKQIEPMTSAWENPPKLYQLNWHTTKSRNTPKVLVKSFFPPPGRKQTCRYPDGRGFSEVSPKRVGLDRDIFPPTMARTTSITA